MKATSDQKQYIYRLCGYNTELKEELVQWVTEDVNKISTNDLTFEQANAIIKNRGGSMAQYDNWGFYDNTKDSHRQILSHLITLGWTVKHPKYGKVADLVRFSEWLKGNAKSGRSPVKKPLKKMTSGEVSKVIHALGKMIGKRYA